MTRAASNYLCAFIVAMISFGTRAILGEPSGSKPRLAGTAKSLEVPDEYSLVEHSRDLGSVLFSGTDVSRFTSRLRLQQSASGYDDGAFIICLARTGSASPCTAPRHITIQFLSGAGLKATSGDCKSGSCIAIQTGTKGVTADLMRYGVDLRQEHEFDIELETRNSKLEVIITDRETHLSGLVNLQTSVGAVLGSTRFDVELSGRNGLVSRNRRTSAPMINSHLSGLMTVIDVSQPCGNGANSFFPTGINSFGDVAGLVDCLNGGGYWTDTGGFTNIVPQSTNPGGLFFQAFINGSDQIVGNYEPPLPTGAAKFPPRQAVYWDKSRGLVYMSPLGNVWGSFTNGINDFGKAVGVTWLTKQENLGVTEAYVWDITNGYQSLSGLFPAGTKQSSADAINNKGTIIGDFNAGSLPETHFFQYDATNGFKDLLQLGLPPNFEAEPLAINDNGQILIGAYFSAGRHTELYFWDPETGLTQITPNGIVGLVYAQALNNSGQVVVSSANGFGSGFVWDREHGARDINTFIDPTTSAGWKVSGPMAINDAGDIAALGSFNNGPGSAVILKASDISQVYNIDATFSTSLGVLGGAQSKSADAGFNWNPGDLGLGGYFSVFPLGEFGAKADNTVALNAGLSFGYSWNPGTVAAFYPATIRLEFPDKYDVIPGQSFLVQSNLIVDSSASFSTTPPVLDANVSAHVNGDFTSHIGIKAFDATLLDQDILNYHPRYTKTLFDLTDVLGGQQEHDFSLLNGAISGQAHIPHVHVQGTLDPRSHHITGSGKDTFLTMKLDFTQAVADLFGVSLDFPINLSVPDGGVTGDLKLMQLSYNSQIGLNQNLDLSATPSVTLAFPNTSLQPVTFNAGDAFSLTLPTGDNDVYVQAQPTLTLQNSVTNTFVGEFDRSLSFIPVEFNLDGQVAGFNLIDVDMKPYDDEEQYGPQFLPLSVESSSLTGFNKIVGDPIIITSKLRKAPTISAAEPSALGIYIVSSQEPENLAYSEFSAFLGQSTTLTIRGSNYWPRETQVQFSLYGYTVTLAANVLNSGTLQVSLPNELRLLPGIAQITVTTAHSAGPSNSVDFSLEYPVPQISNAAPNIWAADPHFTDAFVTIVGSNFIDRPDYFSAAGTGSSAPRLQRFWNKTAPQQASMSTLFTGFPFESSAYRVSIMWNGKPLSVYPEPSPSGLIPSLLPNNYFDRSQVVSVAVTNPLPGGGVSPNPVQIWIESPQPQITSVEPSTVFPALGMSVYLKVSGTSFIPFEDPGTPALGFEANSTILVDGNPIPTTFISATQLVGQLILPVLGSSDSHSIQVENPFVNQDGTTGKYDSTAFAISISNPVPQINTVYPAAACVGEYSVQNQTASNFTLLGAGLLPNSTAYVNGTPRPAVYTSANRLDIMLSPSDVVAQTTLSIKVVNPNPGGGSSNSWSLLVSDDQPQITAISPQQFAAGGADSNLQIVGSHLKSVKRALVNGTDRTVTVLSDSSASVSVKETDILRPGSLALILTNGSTDYCPSQPVSVPVVAAQAH